MVIDADKKEGILRAAARAFAHLGFRKASIADIASAAGVAKGTIYLCATSKRELFYQVLLRDVRDLMSDLNGVIDPQVPADELLRRQGRIGMKFLDDHPLARALVAGPLYLELPGWEQRLEDVRALIRGAVAEVLRLGMRQGRFRSNLDVYKTSRILQDLQEAGYLFFHRAGGRNADELAQRLDEGLDLVLHGLLVPASR